VLLIEAGPDYGSDQAAWPAALRDHRLAVIDSHQWEHRYPRPGNAGSLDLPRGRVLGGSGAVNACVWFRGSRIDYDSWAALGNPGWGFADLVPYFRRAEADPLAAGNPLHGADGPVPVQRLAPEELTPLERALFEAAGELGFERIADMNDAPDQRPGVGPAPRNVVDGVRMNPAFTYLAPARRRPNLTILPDTLIDRVVFHGTRAVAVRAADGREFRGGEIVLAGGAYDSPAILLRSGVGPADDLAALGIPVVRDLPGVGQHLLDHPGTGLAYNRYHLAEGASLHQGIHTFAKARSGQADRDIDLHLYWGVSADAATGAPFFASWAILMRARSQGTVCLTSPDPEAPLAIDLNYFADPADLEALCDGVELARCLAETPPANRFLARAPNAPQWRDRDELRVLARRWHGTTHHPSSTCRMGPGDDPTAVVDHIGRVHGLTGLRVADASIFPTSPRANLHFTVCAVAEKLADMMQPETVQ
jgi:choline dehydrogenase